MRKPNDNIVEDGSIIFWNEGSSVYYALFCNFETKGTTRPYTYTNMEWP